MKNKFTLQKEFGKYGARWACYATAILNICENELKKKFTHDQLLTLTGRWFETQSVFVANYHNHQAPLDRGYLWDAGNDPEWHFLVGNAISALKDCFYVKGRPSTTKKAKYYLCEFDVYQGHWCLMIDNEIINPDPNITVSLSELKEKIPIKL